MAILGFYSHLGGHMAIWSQGPNWLWGLIRDHPTVQNANGGCDSMVVQAELAMAGLWWSKLNWLQWVHATGYIWVYHINPPNKNHSNWLWLWEGPGPPL